MAGGAGGREVLSLRHRWAGCILARKRAGTTRPPRGTAADRSARPCSCKQRCSMRATTNEIRYDGETSIPSLLVLIAGLRPEDLARELAGQRRRTLDDAGSVPRSRARAGACLLRL